MSKREEQNALFCSFCGKSQKEVKKLVAGPSVYICEECISLCNDIIAEEEELRVYECDGLTAYRQLPMIVVLPETTEQVLDMLKELEIKATFFMIGRLVHVLMFSNCPYSPHSFLPLCKVGLKEKIDSAHPQNR